jgi:four helix bundle protein
MILAPFQRLKIWSEANSLALEIYRISSIFPKEEKYCLTSQIRRSAISIPANIAEGTARKSRKDMFRFMDIALGSLHETIQHCIITRELKYAPIAEIDKIISRYHGLAVGIRKFIEARQI